MSGFKSSGPGDEPVEPAVDQRGAQAADQPVSLTVHSVSVPDAQQRRTAMGRLKMLLILLACAAPVVASYFTYYVVRPQARTNYSSLISPAQALPKDLLFTNLDGQPVSAQRLLGQWLLVTVSLGPCDAKCEKHLYMQRQLREMLGRDRDRLDKVWLIASDEPLSPALRAAVEAPGAMHILRVPASELARWLQPQPGHTLADHLYMVDPFGQWMMRSPADPVPEKLKRDLDRLMRASAGWDQAGR